jgi:hypothetical protein
VSKRFNTILAKIPPELSYHTFSGQAHVKLSFWLPTYLLAICWTGNYPSFPISIFFFIARWPWYTKESRMPATVNMPVGVKMNHGLVYASLATQCGKHQQIGPSLWQTSNDSTYVRQEVKKRCVFFGKVNLSKNNQTNSEWFQFWEWTI